MTAFWSPNATPWPWPVRSSGCWRNRNCARGWRRARAFASSTRSTRARKPHACPARWRMAARRLLVVSDEMEVGGSQRQITHLLGGLDRTRWAPELLYFRNRSFLIDEVADLGIPVRHLPKQGRIDPGFVLRYAALLRSGRYDLVHAFSL